MAKQQQMPPVTTGPIDKVPCPNCGKVNNFHGHHEMIDTGTVFMCDHCKLPMQICGIRQIKVISLRKPVGQVSSVRPRR